MKILCVLRLMLVDFNNSITANLLPYRISSYLSR